MIETTHSKGEIAQLKVELRSLEKDLLVSKPTRHESRYDCIIDDKGKLFRAQVKYASGIDPRSKNSVRVELRKVHKNRILRYLSSDIDLLLVYIPQIDKILSFDEKYFANKDCIYVKINEKSNLPQSNWFEDFIW